MRLTDEEQAMCRIQPPLRESEWAMYAAASCKTAMLMAPGYLQRCEKQGYYSRPSQWERAVLSGIDIQEHLFAASREMAEFIPWADEIRASLSNAYFNQSYFNFNNGRRFAAYKALINAIKVHPSTSYLRFGLRMLLPKAAAPD